MTITPNQIPFNFKIEDLVLDPAYPEIQFKILDLPDRCKILGVKERSGCVMEMECSGCKMHGGKPGLHKIGNFDLASWCFNNNYFKLIKPKYYSAKEIEGMLNEILESIPSDVILDPFDAGVVSTVAIIKQELGIK